MSVLMINNRKNTSKVYANLMSKYITGSAVSIVALLSKLYSINCIK